MSTTIGISRHDVSQAIDAFLSSQLQAKLEPELKKQKKIALGSEQAQTIEATITALHKKFDRQAWLEQAATTMARQLKFGTHISKGIHPDSKGDNINFSSTQVLPKGIVGSQMLSNPELDANGNAAALPLATFFAIEVKGEKLRDLIQRDNPALKGVFADSPSEAESYLNAFRAALSGTTKNPRTHTRNKQVLWPLDKAISHDNYHCLVPLYPISLAHRVYQKINGRRFSEANKVARENRKKKSIEQKPYISIVSLAVTQLGGTKPQNISLLSSKQGGRNFLLESLPPSYKKQHVFTLSKRQESFFTKQLAYHFYEELQALYAVIDSPKSTVAIRDRRKEAVGLIIGQVFQLAATIQQNYTHGWSKDYDLKWHYKYWLDPRRESLEGEEDFKQLREKNEWTAPIMNEFSLWINLQLKKQFPKKDIDFSKAEQDEWCREIESAIKGSQRANQGIFL